MFIFGHLGFGRALLRRWHHQLPWLALGLGILLPDVIDKPLYYSELSSFFSCTRTVGHTGLLVILLAAIGWFRRAPVLLALSAGMTTHIVLDIALELLVDHTPGAAWIAATWPLHGLSFDQVTFTMTEHVGRLATWPIVVFEAMGLLLLWLEVRRRREAHNLKP